MDRLSAFDVYFASVVSIQYHPRQMEKGGPALSLEQCAKVAMDMLMVRELLKEDICLSQQQ